MTNDINADLNFLSKKFHISKASIIISNRGFHALFIYRISNFFYKLKIPLLPLILTRLIQILYGIDIDFKCKIFGGVIIIHGIGLVIGQGVIINQGVIIYHCVTLGRKFQITEEHPSDGFPIVGKNCVLGAGAKILGNVKIGDSSIVGANVVLTKSIESNSIVKINEPYILKVK
ncbi:serine O-acetyltransferase [Flavobacterium nitrogenifigens]|uniref:serine O-acetyltransferase n=1 Tax=Flavobacterium nitrogenifigens TaxID=1617283 RepID=UPI001AD6F74A|nr:DapH/DapD/GlmU-related protein [Flavobacterium nitrogenifigens]